MRRLTVDLDELAAALDGDGPPDAAWYLDLETGELAMITDEERQELDAVYDDLPPAGQPQVSVAEALEGRDVPEWMKELIILADAVEKGLGTRYVEVPETGSRPAYEDMEDFIKTVADDELQALLWRAIEGRGAFRRFKDTLADQPAEQERWYAFRDARRRERAIAWLREEDIEPSES
jgi:hypothetical protein